jgi:hypothetical protein
LEYIGARGPGEWSSEALSRDIGPLISESIEQAMKEKISELEAKSIAQENKPKETIQAASQGDEDDDKAGNTPPLSFGGMAKDTTFMQPSDSQIETHRYTSLLFEYGSRQGIVPTYSKTQISSYPMCWMCEAQFGDHSAKATAGSFKEARHQASYLIYSQLGLSIT